MALATRIRIDVASNVDDVQQSLEFAAVGVSDFRPAFRALEPHLEASWRRLFESQGASAGVLWPAYAQTPEAMRYVTVKSRMLGRDISNDDLLRWEPGVRERLYPSLARRTSDSVRRFGRTRMARGTRLVYARHHNLGVGYAPRWAWPKETGRYQIPRRRLMIVDRRFARQDAPRVLEDWLSTVVARSEGAASRGVRGAAGALLDMDGGPSNAF